MAEERELANEERAGSGKEGRRQSDSKKNRYPTEKPWELVVFIVLGLALLVLYIGWLNAPDNTNGGDILSYLLGNSGDKAAVDPSTASSDPLAIWGESPLISTAPEPDSPGDNLWNTEPQENPDPVSSKPFQGEQPVTTSPAPPPPVPILDNTPAAPPVRNEAPSGMKTYQIVAGKFKSRGSAQSRIRELGQGNYPAKLVEPNSADGFYEVIAGEFESYKRAKRKADEIGFILELKTTVEEKVR